MIRKLPESAERSHAATVLVPAAEQIVTAAASVGEAAVPVSDGDASDIDDAHHHGETCTCNLRGE